MGKRGRERLSGMRVGDSITTTWKESVDVLMEKFLPAARANVNFREEVRLEERQFEWGEVDEAVKRARLRKASGLDGMCTEMLRMIWRAIPV